jgi:hypothetical protein
MMDLPPEGGSHKMNKANLRLVPKARASPASEPRDRSAPATRRARERVGESEGRSPSDKANA